MTKTNTKYWDILTEEERTAITLSISYEKSTWEAGEIMKKPHYKFLEIKSRAEKFTRMFVEYFNKWPGFIPDQVPLSSSFIQFLQLTILERKPVHEAVKLLDDMSYLVVSARTRLIKVELAKLQNSKSDWAIDLHKVILEFDRWNNTRILPAPLQQPSAFKRRNKIKILKHFRNLAKIHKLTISRLIERYNYTGKFEKLYTVILSRDITPQPYRILTFKKDYAVINYFNSVGYPIFTDRATAEQFSKVLTDYLFDNARTCTMGQKFWPAFRELLLKTDNYIILNNIIENQRYLENSGF